MTFADLPDVLRHLRFAYARTNTPVAALIRDQTQDPFKILVATLLSARTRDETTAQVVRRLFSRIQSLRDLDETPLTELEGLIHPVGFFRQKARHLKALPHSLQQEFNNIIPDTVDELCRLPGVGRKTANLVVATAFGKPAIAVDVHVHRISNRWGLVHTRSPRETEAALRAQLPRRYWREWNFLLVGFGQTRCRPRNPRCRDCPLNPPCRRIGIKVS